MDEFVYRGPYGYIEEANYQSITTGGASGGKSETDKEQSEEIAKLNEAVSATSEAVAANTENIETLQSDVDEIKGAGYQTEDQVKDAISEVVDGAPEALDTLKEIADKLSDNDDAVAGLVNSVADAQAAADAADAKADAVKEELEAEIEEKADASALNETNNAVAALSDRVDAIEVPSLSGYATEEWVEEQNFATTDAVEAVDAKVDELDAKVEAIVIPSVDDLAKADDLDAEILRAMNKEGELADSIAEKASNENLNAEVERATAAEQALDTKIEELEIPSIDGLATVEALDAEISARTAADEALQTAIDAIEVPDVTNLATKDEVEAVDAKVDALDIPSIDGLATVEALDAEVSARTAADEALQAAIDAIEIPVVDNFATKDEVEAVDAKVDALEIPSVDGLAEASAVTAEIAAAVAILNTKDAEQDATIEEKANADDVYTKAEADAKFLTNEALEGLATEDFVSDEIEKVVGAAPENFDTLEEFADALADLKVVDVPAQPGEHYTQEEIDAAQEGDDAYGKTTDDWKVEPVEEQSHNMTITEFVESVNEKPQIESINRKYEALLTLLNLSDADVNSVIVNQELVDSNSVVFDEGPINNIVVPETTKSKTITAELDPDTDLTLTSRYSVTINNTGEEPTNLNVNAPAVSGYNAATITLNGGEYDTVTLKDASLTVQSGATVQNVVITQDTTKNLTINAMFAEGATVTSESEAAITLTSKNPEGEEVSVVLDAPGASVTLNNGRWESIEATVSPNTLTINANVHVGSLTMNQGNVIVKVPRMSDIPSVVENMTLAEGCTVDYLHDEITSANVSKLSSTGTHVLVEDIAKNGRIVPGIFASDDIVWDLNGHNITFTNTQGYANFLLRGTVHLEINGNGVVRNDAGDYGFWTSAQGAKLVVNGGTYYAATHVLYAENGTIEVNGGEFHLTDGDTAEKDVNGNFKFLLNCHDAEYVAGTAKIIVKGGKFYGFNPSESYGEPGGPVSFVADGFHVVESLDGDMKVFEVVAD